MTTIKKIKKNQVVNDLKKEIKTLTQINHAFANFVEHKELLDECIKYVNKELNK